MKWYGPCFFQYIQWYPVAYPGILFRGFSKFWWGQSADRKGVWGWSGVPLNLQMSENRILIRLLQMYFPRNWEFGSALSKLQNWGGLNPPHPSVFLHFDMSHTELCWSKPYKFVFHVCSVYKTYSISRYYLIH
jgi:hypothetical protein